MARKKKRPMRPKTRKMILAIVLLVLVGGGVGAVYVVPVLFSSPGERRLVGTWELAATTPASVAKAPPAGSPLQKTPPGGPGGKVAEFFEQLGKSLGKSLEGWAASLNPDIRVSFERNGTFTESMGYGGRRQVLTGEWEVVEPGEDRVVVRIRTDEANPSRATDLTITFEGDDVMLYPAATGQPLRLSRRVED